jgi:hypothetical protein
MAKIKKNRPEKKLVVKVPGDIKRISTLDILKIAILKVLDGKKPKKSVISPNGLMPNMDRMNDISTLAIIVDGEVVDIMRSQPRLTSILLAEPKFVKLDPSSQPVRIGDKYSDGLFISSEDTPELEITPKEFNLGDSK